LDLATNVLVVTSDEELTGRLKADERESISFRFARNAYEASMVVESFLPAFAVVDREILGSDSGLVRSLARDRRLPGLKIVLAVTPGTRGRGTGEDWPFIVNAIEKPFGAAEIAGVVDGFPVETLTAAEIAGLSQPGKRSRTVTEDSVGTLAASLSEDGFLKTMADWDPAMAAELAELHGIGKLTHDHWRVIEFVQHYYRTYGTGPPVIRVHKETGLSAAEICRLFPCGMVKGAYRLAGLPHPPGCAG
jgi:tRNA 2-thiouridine synthesizing protein E